MFFDTNKDVEQYLMQYRIISQVILMSNWSVGPTIFWKIKNNDVNVFPGKWCALNESIWSNFFYCKKSSNFLMCRVITSTIFFSKFWIQVLFYKSVFYCCKSRKSTFPCPVFHVLFIFRHILFSLSRKTGFLLLVGLKYWDLNPPVVV